MNSIILEDLEFISAGWAERSKELKQIRSAVFIDEQGVPEELEWDEFDTQSQHFLAIYKNQAVATARLKPDGQIGRMAVLKEYRNNGVGSKLLSSVLAYAINNNYNMLYLHAQQQAVDFYQRFGFINNGIKFIDAGIVHQAMYKVIT